MAWKAQLVGKIREKDRLRINVRFFDDTNETSSTFIQEFIAGADTVSINWVRKQVFKKLQELETLEQTIGTLQEGDIVGLSDPTPTAEEVARATYIQKLNTFRHMQNGIQLGIFTGSEPQITSQKQWLVDNFQNAFIELL